MTATYFRSGRGKSLNAYAAEDNGLLPLSRIGRGTYIKAAAEIIGAAEWHHVGKYAAECDYYDARAIKACAAHLKGAKRTLADVKALREARWERRYVMGTRGAALRQWIYHMRRSVAAWEEAGDDYSLRRAAEFKADIAAKIAAFKAARPKGE